MIRKGITMRCVRTCLTTIALLMVPCQSVHADIEADCATIAANISTINDTDVDAWLARYREAYALCRSQHEVSDGPPAKSPEQANVVKYPSPKVSRIEKNPSKANTKT